MSKLSSERRKKEQQKATASTIGYCFVIVLVVLLVMSKMLSSNYVEALKLERNESMKAIAVATSAELSHSTIAEGMTYPLPIYQYAKDKNYIINIYLKAGNSFIRAYSSENTSTKTYTLDTDQDNSKRYNECFETQTISIVTRTENKTSYIGAIAPIISSQNTIAGIIEISMPMTDYLATVNGMSLSWIFTIFAIAVSVGVIIYEFNILITSVSRGPKGNCPVLISYGKDACRFSSFFFSFSAIMQPLAIAVFIRDSLQDNQILAYGLVAVALFLYACGFFGFSGLRRSMKNKLTTKVALLVSTVFSYLLALLSGFIGNPYIIIIASLPIAIANGTTLDFLRDYRINASKLGYNYDDKTIHNIQSSSYYLGISVGTVLTGIFYERFGILVVMIVSGAFLILTSFAMTFFMKKNTVPRESYLPINVWLEMFTDKYVGKILLSGFVVLGVVFAFLICFVPLFLGTVGISLATASFYYLLCAFVACFLTLIIKKYTDHLLNSKLRVIISSGAALSGMLFFALMPTAKVLVITVSFLGISLGIHDFTYLYVAARLAANRIKGNIRRACELSFLFGMVIAIIFYVVAIGTGYLQIVLVIGSVLLAAIAFIYPLSSASVKADSAIVNAQTRDGGNRDGNVE